MKVWQSEQEAEIFIAKDAGDLVDIDYEGPFVRKFLFTESELEQLLRDTFITGWQSLESRNGEQSPQEMLDFYTKKALGRL